MQRGEVKLSGEGDGSWENVYCEGPGPHKQRCPTSSWPLAHSEKEGRAECRAFGSIFTGLRVKDLERNYKAKVDS